LTPFHTIADTNRRIYFFIFIEIEKLILYQNGKNWQGGKKHLIKSDLSFNIKCEESKMF